MLYLAVSVIGYMIGNFATSFFVGKATRNIDIRHHGSGNAGATNTFRVLGFTAGIIVFVGDVLKGIAAVLIGRWIAGDIGAVIAGGSAVIGHDWPVVLGFKGGKGIATSFGCLIILFPKIALILFIVAILIIIISRYVSLASISASIGFPIAVLFFQEYRSRWEYVALSIVLSIIALCRHKANILRLLEGRENKISLKTKV
jgi:glycerol-3-phosphate acyltransferase PlsY